MVLVLFLVYVFIILRYDFVTTYPSYISADNFRFLHQFLINSVSLKITLKIFLLTKTLILLIMNMQEKDFLQFI